MTPRGAVLVWYAGGMLAAVAIGWIAARLNVVGIAPVGLSSLCVGGVLGGTLTALAVSQSRRPGPAVLTGSPHVVIGTILLALVTILAEHAWLYRDFRRQWHAARANSPEVALFRPAAPWSPAEYFARELSADRAALWALDAVLVIAAAVIVVIVARRPQQSTRPYGRR
jgi:hypothetical protein